MVDTLPTVRRRTGSSFLQPRSTIIPNNPFFGQVLRHAYRMRLCVRDVNLDLQKTYADLVIDALALRSILVSRLSESVVEAIANDDEVFIGILAPGGYEYVVAVLAVLALGAAVVPMSEYLVSLAIVLPVEEACYFVKKSRQVAVLTAARSKKLGDAIVENINAGRAGEFQSIEILENIENSSTDIEKTLEQIQISCDTYQDDNKPGVVVFTSGTTGRPKGAILPRGYIHEASRGLIDHFELTPNDVLLHMLPVHHVTGLAINIFPFLLAGACIEFRSGSFDAAWTWDRWIRGGLTIFSAVPTIYMRMMRHYQQVLAKLPREQQHAYHHSVGQFRILMCGTSALPRPLQEFWTGLNHGRKVLTRYGSTEAGAVLRMPPNASDIPDGSVGQVETGVDLKLSGGEEGEILVRSPHLFSRYLFDEKATKEAFDSNGYYKTGDIARREGKHYFIIGRASQDIIKSGGYKISALDIEREILALPYIDEVIVVGVPDDEFGQRVGAIVTLLDEHSQPSHASTLTIGKLRDDLRSRLAGYKLPTLLRVVEGDLPKTASGKVLKKALGESLFPSPGWREDKCVEVWDSGKSSKL